MKCTPNWRDYTYDSADELVSMNLNGKEYYYIRNAQGDITGLFDDKGAQVVTYTYDTWGKPVSITGSLASTVGVENPYRYRGYRYDTETGLYYLQSRYYDPVTCRMLNADYWDTLVTSPMELTDKNLFAYCDNNPVMREDKDGQFWMLIGAGIGALVGGTVSAVSQYASTGKINWAVVGVNAASGAISGAVASTGVGLVAPVVINSALGGATYAAEQAVQGKKITTGGLVASTVAGGIGGIIGGKGANANGLSSAWKSASKGIVREVRRANVKYATKQIAKYTAEKVAIKKMAIVSTGRLIAGSAANAKSRSIFGY